jgi:hypothetical protein
MGGATEPGMRPPGPLNAWISGRRSSTAKNSTFLAPGGGGLGGGGGGQCGAGRVPEVQIGRLGAWPCTVALESRQVPGL